MICLLPHAAYLSETSRMIAIYKALAARGASVVMATHGGLFEGLIASEGIPYERLSPTMDEARCRRFIAENVGVGANLDGPYSDAELEALSASQADFFRRRGVRAVVTGFEISALLSARLAGVPLITEHAGAFVAPVFERGLAPAPSIPPPPLRRLPAPLIRLLMNTGAHRRDLWARALDRTARRLGVEGVPSLPALLMGDLTLVTETPEVLGIPQGELHAWRPRHPRAYRQTPTLRYVGPMFAELDLPVPARVEAFLAAPGPVAYVALTSTPEETVRRAALRVAEAGVRVLVAGSGTALPGLERDGVMVEGVLPSHKIMPRVAFAVTAGGQGSVQCAMAAGTPLIAAPLHWEQDFNVDRVARLGAALMVPMREAGGPVMTRAARKVLRRPSYRRAAGRIAALYRDGNGPANAAQAILDYLA